MDKRITEQRESLVKSVLASVEAGEQPVWRKPWDPSVGAQRNPVTGHNQLTGGVYRGLNQLYLLVAAELRGFTDHRWVTFRQATKMRFGSFTPLTPEEYERNRTLSADRAAERIPTWHVKKGAKAEFVEIWRRVDPAEQRNGQDAPDDERKPYLFCRLYSVFNASEIEGIPPLPKYEYDPSESHLALDGILGAMNITVAEGGSSAFYVPSHDTITMPPKAAFFGGVDAYYATLAHEISHATGHPARLNRETLSKGGSFGSETYAQEELCAELAAAFLARSIGLLTPAGESNSHEYLVGWMRSFKERPETLFQALSAANAAVTYCLGMLPDMEIREEADAPAVAERTIADVEPTLAPSIASGIAASNGSSRNNEPILTPIGLGGTQRDEHIWPDEERTNVPETLPPLVRQPMRVRNFTPGM
ncbi:MAG: ArdC family protein [Vulcanimicrobiaceae bacterium]